MKSGKKSQNTSSVFYITRDLERALPLVGKKNSFIISNESTFSKKILKKASNITLIKSGRILDTRELLDQIEVKKIIDSKPNPEILVFKNTSQIERICTANNWKILNPPASLSTKIEEKLSQIEWLENLSDLLPPHRIISGKDLYFTGESFIAQFNRSHTGLGTIFVKSENEAEEIRKTFPNRPIKITKFIDGPVFTNNNIVFKNKTLTGPISYQITGLSPFTSNPFATIGNDWDLPKKILKGKLKKDYSEMVKKIGTKMRNSGWRGLFGIDVILDTKKNRLYLLEINARQPASTTFESILQKNSKRSTFSNHLEALKSNNKFKTLITNISGAQIILRVSHNYNLKILEKMSKELNKKGFSTIPYDNLEQGSDSLRIMAKKGIMLAHNELNKHGEIIKKIVEKYAN